MTADLVLIQAKQDIVEYLEELLQQMPVALLPLDACHVLKGVHLYIIRKVSRQQLCHQKAISKVPKAGKKRLSSQDSWPCSTQAVALPFRIFDGVFQV